MLHYYWNKAVVVAKWGGGAACFRWGCGKIAKLVRPSIGVESLACLEYLVLFFFAVLLYILVFHVLVLVGMGGERGNAGDGGWVCGDRMD